MSGLPRVSLIIQPLIEKGVRNIHLNCEDNCHLIHITTKDRTVVNGEYVLHCGELGDSASVDYTRRKHGATISYSSNILRGIRNLHFDVIITYSNTVAF